MARTEEMPQTVLSNDYYLLPKDLAITALELMDVGVPDWQEKAACQGMGFEAFFGKDESRLSQQKTRVAKKICRTCPVQLECELYTEVNGDEYGIWAGQDRTASPIEEQAPSINVPPQRISSDSLLSV